MDVHSNPSWTLTPIFAYNFLTDILVFDNFSAGRKMKNGHRVAAVQQSIAGGTKGNKFNRPGNAAGVTGRTEGVTI